MRTAPLFIALTLILAGCSGGKQAENTPGTETAVTFDNPTQKENGEVTMAELCEKAGIAPLPGSESAKGIRYDRSDGGSKDEITFVAKMSMEEIGKFFEGQKLSTKVLPKEGSSMGLTKTDAQLIISFKPADKGSEVTIRSLWYPPKKQ
ncbi:MAG TPA: hypothetical protein VK171_12485 [Fimbriimonas sp.]|nr:hypothetical protein [Fimbriimonas sp.]